MTDEKKLEMIKSCIEDLEEYENNKELSKPNKLHIKKAINEYLKMYEEALRGRIDTDLLYENITSYLYILQ